MNFRQILVPVAGILLIAFGYERYGWPGVAVVTGAVLMFLLLHFTRAMTVLRRAGDRPIGYVGSAVMLNAKLKPGMSLMHVVAFTRALGELRTPKGEDPELYRWTDQGGSWVDAEFVRGKLHTWSLTRPQQPAEAPAGQPPAAP